MDDERRMRTFARIEALQRADPEGAEALYAARMAEALDALAPRASEALQVAVRAQHLERWTLARSSYPSDRRGYLAWRMEQSRRHAARVAQLLEEEGHDATFIARVGALVQKKSLGTDDEAQTLEDCACLVFLGHGLASFADGRPDAEVVGILQKSWRKMSARGRAAALERAPGWPAEAQRLIALALEQDGPDDAATG